MPLIISALVLGAIAGVAELERDTDGYAGRYEGDPKGTCQLAHRKTPSLSTDLDLFWILSLILNPPKAAGCSDSCGRALASMGQGRSWRAAIMVCDVERWRSGGMAEWLAQLGPNIAQLLRSHLV